MDRQCFVGDNITLAVGSVVQVVHGIHVCNDYNQNSKGEVQQFLGLASYYNTTLNGGLFFFFLFPSKVKRL